MTQELDFRNILVGEVTYLQSIVQKLQSTGTIFGALYCKKDGSLTQINGRFGVHKFLRGGKRTAPDTMLVIWDNNRKRYTSIHPERIISMRVQKKEYVNFSYKS
jgi:hypothetical protein